MVAGRKERLQLYLETLLELPMLRACALLQAFLNLQEDAHYCQTLTVCPICTVINRKAPTAIMADWLRQDGRLVQQVNCSVHGALTTLLSDNATSYEQIAFQPLHCLVNTLNPAASALLHRTSTVAIHDVALGLGDPTADLHNLADTIATINPDERAGRKGFTRTLVRFDGIRCASASVLNAAMRQALQLTPKQRVAVCTSPDRLLALAELPDSVLLNPRVYPSVRLHLKRGYETQTRHDLVTCLGSLAAYTDMQVAVELLVERPWPDLSLLFESLLRHKAMIRWIGVGLTRNSSQLMKVGGSSFRHFAVLNFLQRVFVVERVTK